MIVCSCNVLSETAVRAACHADAAPRTPGQVYRCLGCSPQCGRCARTIKAILDQSGVVCPPSEADFVSALPPRRPSVAERLARMAAEPPARPVAADRTPEMAK